MKRCPAGYCCEEAPCVGLESCSENREGVLCGRCKPNFAEALSTEKCMPNSDCHRGSFFLTVFCWVLFLAVLFIFLGCSDQLVNCIESKWYMYSGKAGINRKSDCPAWTRSQETFYHSDSSQPVEIVSKGIFQIRKVTPASGTESSFTANLEIVLFYLQDVSVLQIDLADISAGIQTDPTVECLVSLLFEVSQLSLDVTNLSGNMCIWPDSNPVQKLLLKNVIGPSILLFYFCLYLLSNIVIKFCAKKPDLKKQLYTHISLAAVFVLLLFYQNFTDVTMSLIYCVKIEERYVLFIDGTVSCYQIWQMGVGCCGVCTWMDHSFHHGFDSWAWTSG